MRRRRGLRQDVAAIAPRDLTLLCRVPHTNDLYHVGSNAIDDDLGAENHEFTRSLDQTGAATLGKSRQAVAR